MDSLQNATILVVDDDPQVLSLLKGMLAKKCKEVILANSARQSVEIACEKQPDLILLDVMIGRICGYDVCKQLKACEQTHAIPVIFLSSLGDPLDKVKGFEAGGVDYIAKPFDIREVLARVSCSLKIHQKIQQPPSQESQTLDAKLQPYQLTQREIEILQHYMSGYKRSDIAEKVHVSENTVKWYLKQIFQKLNVSNRAELQEKIRALT